MVSITGVSITGGLWAESASYTNSLLWKPWSTVLKNGDLRRRFGPVGPETVDGSAPRWRVNGPCSSSLR